MTQHESAHLSLIDEHLKLSNLSSDLVLFADEVMDTLGQLFLKREKRPAAFRVSSRVYRALNAEILQTVTQVMFKNAAGFVNFH